MIYFSCIDHINYCPNRGTFESVKGTIINYIEIAGMGQSCSVKPKYMVTLTFTGIVRCVCNNHSSLFSRRKAIFSSIYSSLAWFSDINSIILTHMDIPLLSLVFNLGRSMWSNFSLWKVRGSLLQGKGFLT